MLEKITDRRLDKVLRELVLRPLGLSSTIYCPPKRLLPRIAPTEYDQIWRKRLIWGEVNDDSAWALGGIAGHAGLFSTAHDLLQFGKVWLKDGKKDRRRFLSESLVSQATKEIAVAAPTNKGFYPGSNGLGWRMDYRFAPKGSYGHGGFTGTLLQIFPEEQAILVFLTTRHYPSRKKGESAVPVWKPLTEAVIV